MKRTTTTLLVVLLAVGVAGSSLTIGTALADQHTTETAMEDTATENETAMAENETATGANATEVSTQDASYLRIVHASPDAPAVNVSMDDETVLTNVSFGAVSDYLRVASGTHNVTITVANESETVVFDGTVTLEPRTVTTVAASGEITQAAETEFAPTAFVDDAYEPSSDEAAIRVVHLSPDAPAVDVTTANGSVVLADDVSFRNASEYTTVPAGNYTVSIRDANETNNGTVVATTNVSLEGGTAYSAFAAGYAQPRDEPGSQAFAVIPAEDATTSVHLPGEADAANETVGTETDVPVAANGTATETAGTDETTPTANGTATETGGGLF